MDAMEEYLQPTFTIDCDNGKIVDTAQRLTASCSSDSEKAVALFYFVRDEISYNLYMSSTYEEDFIASRILDWGKGYCVQKAVLLAALGRAARIPSRLAFAKIRNHRVPEKIVQFIGDNVFPRHGYKVSLSARFPRKSTGSETDYDRAALQYRHYGTWGNHTVSLSVDGGSSFGSIIDIYDQHTLGGIFSSYFNI